ncbi:hypothetical protein ACLB2K_003265 [Fragaria x ananassa]
MKFHTLIIFSLTLVIGASAEQCGRQAGGATCPNGLCCSQFGYCGNTAEYCGTGCQSQCSSGGGGSTPTPTPSGGDVSSIVSASLFDQMLKYRNDARCKSNGFYKYDAFITAARSFNGFGTTGDVATRKKEIAAFLGQTSHETTDLVATDPVVSFKTAVWFWITPQGNKPSSHDVIVGRWNPSSADRAAGRVPGYGVITNIVNGALECGRGADARVADRIGFYKRYCGIFGVSPGDNLDCYNQRSF